VLNGLRRRGTPVTRKTYLEAAYPGGAPRPWTAEHEAELPSFLQKPDAIEPE
jgi:hypothetical protein